MKTLWIRYKYTSRTNISRIKVWNEDCVTRRVRYSCTVIESPGDVTHKMRQFSILDLYSIWPWVEHDKCIKYIICYHAILFWITFTWTKSYKLILELGACQNAVWHIYPEKLLCLQTLQAVKCFFATGIKAAKEGEYN